ncbi:polycystic kidney disease 2-like 2 protein [Macrosteles quadrilineatus]|uniref:polycystic kidney disease 2-like 2 protein n=1 Tax=Macrosteles quadrilineatus TaxID=74068 RepID=UPI0023E183AA|nr:polycystic kidney disease 2-like 2 protein [Macrosteles quadrilineatus]
MSYFTFIFNVSLYINMNKLLPILKDPSYEDKYISFDTPLYLHILFSRSFAVLIAFAFLRLLKYFNIVHSIYRLHSTVHRALPDIMSYFIIFFYLYFVFAFVGLFLFGSKLEDFKTFLLALFALMRYSIADFKFDALEQADPILGPIFFFTYIFFMVFIVASMFLAILVPHYKEVLSEVSIGGAKTFISDMMLIWLMQLLGKLECSWLLSQIEREVYEEKVHSPSEHVRYYLAQAGYSELEIELFFKKYDITDMKIDAMDPTRTNFRKGEREAPPPLSQKDILRYILINKLDYLEGQYGEASKLLDKFLQKLDSVNVK